LVQEAGRLRNRARERGVDAPQGRARTPHWLDWEADGDLDLLMTGILRPDGKDWSGLFLQDGARRPAAFDRAPMDVLGRPQGFLFAQLADVTGDAWPELLMADRVYPRRALAFGAAGSGEVTGRVDLQRVDQVDDAVWADFDGDLRSDVFMATSRGGPSFSTPAPEILEAALHGTHLGVRFRSADPVLFRVYPQNSIEPGGIFIGASAASPSRLRFRVDPASPGSHGLADYRAGEDSGLYIGFDPGEGLWTVMQSHPSWRTINVLATGQKPVTEVVSVRFAPRIPQPDNRLFIRQSRGFADRTVEAMLHGGVAGLSVVAGDFDHDMDVDLYLLSSGPIDNEPNLLYLNQGDGTFRSVAGAGGAAGSLLGRADAVATLDYDRDGDLDLFVVNGLEAEPFSTDGPHQLFENVLEQGDGTRHWLEIDLEGRRSNVEAVGARVEVTAGGTAQVRLQDHGMHRATQNDPLLHFGLGPNPRADEVVVHWPSGRIQRLRDVPADHLLKVVETP
jgi:predicted nucleotidyltransferase